MENNNLELKKTSLYNQHISLNAKMVNFANYLMPINYENGIKKEYECVRNDVGMFDVSHMGVFKITGADSSTFLDRVLSNNIEKLNNNQALYTLLCNESGGVIDDLILYKVNDEYILIVNASNKTKDLDWLVSCKHGDVSILDMSDTSSLIAIQGPNSRDKLQEIFNFDIESLKFYHCKEITYNDSTLFIARTGYTGELGFEILGDSSVVNELWNTMISSNVLPSGLAARDILRIEMGYCLYGHEIDESRNPIDAGLNWILSKETKFIGSKTIYSNDEQKNKIIFVKMIDRGIPREGCEIYKGENKIGSISSGTFSYSLNTGVGIGFIDREVNDYENIFIKIRDKNNKIQISNRPFLFNTSLRK